GVDDEHRPARSLVLEPRPACDAWIGGIPALSGPIGARRQPEGPRRKEVEAVGAITEHRIFAGLLAVVASDPDEPVEGEVGFDLVLLMLEHFLHPEKVGGVIG